jgi:hypothetical protein
MFYLSSAADTCRRLAIARTAGVPLTSAARCMTNAVLRIDERRSSGTVSSATEFVIRDMARGTDVVTAAQILAGVSSRQLSVVSGEGICPCSS